MKKQDVQSFCKVKINNINKKKKDITLVTKKKKKQVNEQLTLSIKSIVVKMKKDPYCIVLIER